MKATTTGVTIRRQPRMRIRWSRGLVLYMLSASQL
jgi:hypothetical protein